MTHVHEMPFGCYLCGKHLNSQTPIPPPQPPQPMRPRAPKLSTGALVPPVQLLSYSTALNLTMVPIEDGERCHVCDRPATRQGGHIAWCNACAVSRVIKNGWTTLGPPYKIPINRHAFKHSHRWYRMLWKYKVMKAKKTYSTEAGSSHGW